VKTKHYFSTIKFCFDISNVSSSTAQRATTEELEREKPPELGETRRPNKSDPATPPPPSVAVLPVVV
jgi:hypothetical protein